MQALNSANSGLQKNNLTLRKKKENEDENVEGNLENLKFRGEKFKMIFRKNHINNIINSKRFTEISNNTNNTFTNISLLSLIQNLPLINDDLILSQTIDEITKRFHSMIGQESGTKNELTLEISQILINSLAQFLTRCVDKNEITVSIIN